MESQTLDYSNLVAVLEKYGQKFIDAYKGELDNGGVNASRKLYDSLKYTVKGTAGIYEIDITLQDYWKYIENGRQPGKWPPVNAIKEWIKIKPVTPFPTSNLKLPTVEQLTYLIGRKIKEKGIKARPLLASAIDTLMDEFESAVGDAIDADIDIILDSAFTGFPK